MLDDAPTRERVAASLLEHGPSTAADLAERLEITPAAIRRHLDLLMEEGVVAPREQRVVGQRGRGRPAKEFRLTDAGHDRFAHAYDELANEALAFLAAKVGPESVKEFAEKRLADLEAKLAHRDHTPQSLADALTDEGFAASVDEVAGGVQVCQHHCPVAHVAEQFPQLCEAETEMFARVLGTHVQRLATIAHGDGVCTTHMPNPEAQETR